jgi:hypothetical protein
MQRSTRDGVEAPMTAFGAYGRPIHRPEQLLDRERLQVAKSAARVEGAVSVGCDEDSSA